jgi:hypothetical protein
MEDVVCSSGWCRGEWRVREKWREERKERRMAGREEIVDHLSPVGVVVGL